MKKLKLTRVYAKEEGAREPVAVGQQLIEKDKEEDDRGYDM